MNMTSVIDPTDLEVARRVVEIQRAAYAVEASLIGFNGIPQLGESVSQVVASTHLHWRGAYCGDQLVGLIAWSADGATIEIDRLAIDPRFARRGYGRQLVQAIPAADTINVSTGTQNMPAKTLYANEGFVAVGQTEIADGIFTTQFRRSNG